LLSLILRLDRPESDSPVTSIFQSLFKSFHGLFSLSSKPTKPIPTTALSPSLPSKIPSLDVELHDGDVSGLWENSQELRRYRVQFRR
ncbi:unnamed protein product, partial [Arabidopsis halleri]